MFRNVFATSVVATLFLFPVMTMPMNAADPVVEKKTDEQLKETALALNELTSTPTLANQVWAMNVVRVIPGIGVDSWAGPTDTTPNPQTMGHLRFIGEKSVTSSPPIIVK